jgi:hypothetical protein
MKIAHLALAAVLGASALAFAAHAQQAPVEEAVVPRPERVCL